MMQVERITADEEEIILQDYFDDGSGKAPRCLKFGRNRFYRLNFERIVVQWFGSA
jgi:hypothetical protein